MGSYVNGVYVPVYRETGWDDELGDFLTREGEREHNIASAYYGADPEGIRDSTDAIIDAITGANLTGGELYVPPGTYKVSRTIDLSDLNYLHVTGGNIGPTRSQAAWDAGRKGAFQFTRAPTAVLDGSYITSGPTFYIDGGASFAGGTHTFEDVGVVGRETAMSINGAARCVFYNTGMWAATNLGTADNAALLITNSFWLEFNDCAIHSPNSAVRPSVILRGDNSSPNVQAASGIFRRCTIVGEMWSENNPGCATPSLPQVYDTLTESTAGCFLRIKETGQTTNLPGTGLIFHNSGIADSGVGNTPLVIIEAAHVALWGPVFSDVQSIPGGRVIQRDVAHYNDPYGNGINGAIITGSNHVGYKVTDGAGAPTGQVVMGKETGFNISGNSALATETDIQGNNGPAIRLARLAEQHAAAGIDTDGKHYWGPGGAGGGWDTNLYRSAADALKTDDALTVSLGLTASKAFMQKVVDLSGSPLAVDASLGSIFGCRTGATVTVGAPTNATNGQVIHFMFLGNGSMALTWDATYHMAGAWTNPANGKWRTISFAYYTIPGVGNAWVELSRAAADIP